MADSFNILTATEVASILRCSKAHVSKAIAGKLPNASPLPALRLGRRSLIRREALARWIEENEGGKLAASPEVAKTVAA